MCKFTRRQDKKMGKIAALDLGDAWIGVALSDTLRFFARPYTTIKKAELTAYLNELLKTELIDTIVIGLPKTMKGDLSEQTKKVLSHKEFLAKEFPDITWVLWDERLSSKRAMSLQKIKKVHSKQSEHAIAAAFILDSYLLFSQASIHI